jgi:hypothetical protein
MNTRQKWLAAALLATLAAVFWPEQQESGDNVVEAIKRPQGQSMPLTRASGSGQVDGNRVDTGTRLTEMQADLFPHQTWVPPPAKSHAASPPPPPRPPPLPFSYLGRWKDGGRETVFLAQGDQPLPIKVGQVVFGSWRVDEISRVEVVFTYLPLNMQSRLGITP